MVAVTGALGPALRGARTSTVGALADFARRALTVSRTLGATPGQVVTALCVAQLLPAMRGVAAGVPAGLVLYWFFGTHITPPGAVLLSAALAILPAVGVPTALPAWIHTRRPAGRVLDAERV